MKINNIRSTFSPNFKGLQFIGDTQSEENKALKTRMRTVAINDQYASTLNNNEFDLYVRMQQGLVEFDLKDKLDELKPQEKLETRYVSQLDQLAIEEIFADAYARSKYMR